MASMAPRNLDPTDPVPIGTDGATGGPMQDWLSRMTPSRRWRRHSRCSGAHAANYDGWWRYEELTADGRGRIPSPPPGPDPDPAPGPGSRPIRSHRSSE